MLPKNELEIKIVLTLRTLNSPYFLMYIRGNFFNKINYVVKHDC